MKSGFGDLRDPGSTGPLGILVLFALYRNLYIVLLFSFYFLCFFFLELKDFCLVSLS